MIQDIGPHIFHNTFKLKEPGGESCFLYFNHGKLLLNHKSDLAIPAYSDLAAWPEEDHGQDTFLFSIDEADYYLIDGETASIPSGNDLDFYDVNMIRELTPLHTAFAAAAAHQLYRFYHANRFCGHCGANMEHSKTERAMICPCCHNVNYPKLAPAVIVGITNGDKLLLTKYAGRDYKRYALVAGYTEFGETLEETVRREVLEEVGLQVKNIRYYKNQPWPFSDTLLVGFFAELDGSPQVVLEEAELSTAKWVKRGDISDDYTNISLTHEMIMLFKHGGLPELKN